MKDYIASRYAPKEEIENARKSTRAEVEGQIRTLAQRIKAAQQNHNRQPQQSVDPLAPYREMAIIQGKDMASALEGTLGPVAQAIAQLQQQNNDLTQHVKRLSGGMGTLAKERGSQARSQRVTQAIGTLGEGYDAKDPFLQDMAQDILDAWEFDKPDEYPQMIATRMKSMEDFFKRKQQADLKRAKTRLFTRPGGAASPNGQARPDPRKMVSNAADILFGPQSRT